MRHHLADGDRALPVRGELRPERRDACLGIELAALHEQVRADRGDALRRGVHEHERVLLPARAVRRIGETAPEVDDRLPVEIHAHRRPDLSALVEVLRERVEHRFEFRRDVTVDVHRRSLFSPGLRAASGERPRVLLCDASAPSLDRWLFRRTRPLVLLTIVAAVVGAGCSSSKSSRPTPSTNVTTPPPVDAPHRDPQDQARRGDHAGEPVVRQLLRDVSRRGRHPDDRTGSRRCACRSGPVRASSRIHDHARRERRRPARCSPTRRRHQRREDGRLRRAVGAGETQLRGADEPRSRGRREPKQRRDGLPHGSDIPNYWTYAQNFVLQDHMFEPNASWSLPEHLFQVSEWSATCTQHDNPRVAPTRSRSRACPEPVDRQRRPGRRHRRRSTRGPTSRTCCTRSRSRGATTSWPAPNPTARTTRGELRAGAAERRRHRGSGTRCRTSTPSATTVQLGNIQSVDNFYAAAKLGILPAVSWVVPSGDVSEHPPASVSAGSRT